MNVRSKLARLARPCTNTAAGNSQRPQQSANLLVPLDMPQPGGRRKNLPLQGSLEVFSSRLDTTAHHGTGRPVDALNIASWALAELANDTRFASIGVEKLLFVDTETTGLRGGTGTLPFLIGLAFFEQDHLVVEQLFLGQMGQEQKILDKLYKRLERCRALVTYNGKCFDWPLIKARFLLARQPLVEPIASLPHIDLLHVCRRMVVGLKDYRLTTLERHVLGFKRYNDVAGADIPPLYFSYLRGAPFAVLKQVIEHNRLDVVAMAALMTVLTSRLSLEAQSTLCAGDLLAVARVKLAVSQQDQAMTAAREAVMRCDPDHAVAAALFAARLYSKSRAYKQAAAILERALLTGPKTRFAAHAHLALAKIFEHKLVDLPRALRHARRSFGAQTPEQATWRLARITLRLGRRSCVQQEPQPSSSLI